MCTVTPSSTTSPRAPCSAVTSSGFSARAWTVSVPWARRLSTADEIVDVGTLRVQTRVNGELRQDAPVSGLIFDIPTLIETLARTMTLAPGDVIATGTPAGVGMGFKPPRFLKKGDVVAITIDPIGTLENPVA